MSILLAATCSGLAIQNPDDQTAGHEDLISNILKQAAEWVLPIVPRDTTAALTSLSGLQGVGCARRG